MLPDKPDERLIIQSLCWQLDAVMEANNATPGLKTIIAIIFAARRTAMPAFAAAAMLSNYIANGDPF